MCVGFWIQKFYHVYQNFGTEKIPFFILVYVGFRLDKDLEEINKKKVRHVTFLFLPIAVSSDTGTKELNRKQES